MSRLGWTKNGDLYGTVYPSLDLGFLVCSLEWNAGKVCLVTYTLTICFLGLGRKKSNEFLLLS